MESITIFPENTGQKKLIEDLLIALHVRFKLSEVEELYKVKPEIKDLEFPKLHTSKEPLPDSITVEEYMERHKNTIISEELANNIENAQKNWSNWKSPW